MAEPLCLVPVFPIMELTVTFVTSHALLIPAGTNYWPSQTLHWNNAVDAVFVLRYCLSGHKNRCVRGDIQ